MIKTSKIKPNNLIKTKERSPSCKKIILDFNDFLFTPIKTIFFTNYYANEVEKTKAYKIFFHSFIPHITEKTFEELKNEGHNHEIKDNTKILLIKNILKEYFKTDYFRKFEFEQFEDDIFQLSSSGGMRVIGLRSGNIFKILFLDPHHLIYENPTFGTTWKYNNFFYKVNDENLIKIIKYDDCISEKCIECEELEK